MQVSDTNACSNTSVGLNVTGLGINDVAEGFDVQLYPNPNNGSFTLVFTDGVGRDVEITDAVGRTAMRATKVSRQQNFDLEQLPAGVYFLRITTAGSRRRRPLRGRWCRV